MAACRSLKFCVRIMVVVVLVKVANGQMPMVNVQAGQRHREPPSVEIQTTHRNLSSARVSAFRIAAFMEPTESDTNHEQSREFQDWIERVRNTYDSRMRPFFGHKELRIKLGMKMMGISSISENSMEFTVEMFFYETWRDPRLGFDPSKFGYADVLTLPLGDPRIWTPDTSFINALRSQAPAPGSVSHLQFIKLSSNGTIFYSRRLSVTAECQFDLTMYPFDQQACRLELSSYGFTVDDIIYEWALQPDSIPLHKMELADFEVPSYKEKVENQTFASGIHSVPQICFVLKRRWGFCLVNLFIPATAVVGSSWISLWLQNETEFADLVAVILAIIFLACSYNAILPKVSYVKATDIYLAACFIFAFLSLVKLAVVKYMHNLTVERRARLQEAASTNLLSALVSGEHISMLAGGQSKRDEVENANGETSSLREITDAPPRGNPNNSSSSINQQHATVIGNGDRIDDTDRFERLRRRMHRFHVMSQLILPIAFGTFGVLYFLTYPNVPPKHVCD